jgi:hypothetical protein
LSVVSFAEATAAASLKLTDAVSPVAPVAVAVNDEANEEGSANEALNEPSAAAVAVASCTHPLEPVSATCTATDSPGVNFEPDNTTVSPVV